MKAKYCDECRHFFGESLPGAALCLNGHKPRWYAPRSDSGHDIDYGYKRKCDDYQPEEKK